LGPAPGPSSDTLVSEGVASDDGDREVGPLAHGLGAPRGRSERGAGSDSGLRRGLARVAYARGMGLVALRRLLAGRPDPTDPALEVALGGLALDLDRLRWPDDDWAAEGLLDGPGHHGSVFLLPRGAAIPLHDHPGMHVLTRVLRGRLRVEAFDWVGEPGGRARPAFAGELAAGPGPGVYRTGPRDGNLHRIEALEDAAFVDLFLPYYGPDRPCTYYRIRDEAAAAPVLEPTGPPG